MKAKTAFVKLRHFWKVLNFLGLFPCYIDKNELVLKPSKTWALSMKFCGVLTICLLGFVMAWINLVNQVDHEKYKWFDIIKSLQNISQGSTDIFALFASYPIVIVSCFLLIFDSYVNLRKSLPKLQNHFDNCINISAEKFMNMKPLSSFMGG